MGVRFIARRVVVGVMRGGEQAEGTFCVGSVSDQQIKAHPPLDNIVGGSRPHDVRGNDRFDKFAKGGVKLHAPSLFGVVALTVQRKLIRVPRFSLSQLFPEAA